MKGLEISEIKKSELERTERIDAEYYSSYQLGIDAVLDANVTNPIHDCIDLSDGNHMGISEEFCTDGIPYYRGGDVHTFFIECSSPAYRISEEVYSRPILKRSHLKRGDVLLTIVGTIGNVAIVSTDDRATCNCKLAILRPKPNLLGQYLAVYLRTKFGAGQINRIVRGSVQMGIVLDDIGDLRLPRFGKGFEKLVCDFVDKSLGKENISKELFNKAQDSLLSELGLADYTPTDETVSVRKFSDFMATKRLDAEYYQPKYDELAERIGVYASGTIAVDTILVQGLERVVEGQRERYVELADIGSAGEITGCTSAAFEELPSRARQRVRRGDVIVSSIEGSLQSCALIGDDFDGALCSTGFHRFRSADINPETLLLLFKSLPIQSLMKRGCSGTILCGILPVEFSSIRLPKIRSAVQTKLADMVQRSFAARKESARLLDLAKLAVETAIEKGEEEGLRILTM